MVFIENKLLLNERELRQLVTRKGFVEVYYRSTKYFKSYKECYERLEEIYEHQYFERKYSCYNSFRQLLNKR